MRTGRVRVWIALAVGAPTLVACTALLGTYEVDPAGSDAGPDTPAPAADTGTDAPVDTGARDAASDAAIDTGKETGVPDASPECDPSDPLLDGPTLINELNDTDFDDRGGRPTPDGKYLLFSRREPGNGEDSSSNIYVAERVAGRWEKPRKLNQLDGINPDGVRTSEGSPMFVPGPTPRIMFGSDRRVPLADGGSFFSSFDFYYAIIKAPDFTDIDRPVRMGETNPLSWNGGGLEADGYIVPSANGGGRAFYSSYIAGNHADLFYLDYNKDMTGTARMPVAAANLPADSLEYSPAFGNGFLYFTSGRVSLADGGVVTSVGPDASTLFANSKGRVWASRVIPTPTPTFGAPVLVADLNSDDWNTLVTWVSPDGCSLMLASDRPGGSGPAGTFHLYTAKRKPKKP
jgi:hypothetical protein